LLELFLPFYGAQGGKVEIFQLVMQEAGPIGIGRRLELSVKGVILLGESRVQTPKALIIMHPPPPGIG
jgi:hypothetical protein